MLYEVDFGTANAGGVPAFTTFSRLPDYVDLAAPVLTDRGDGIYSFVVDWSTTTATSISFKVALAGIEKSDVISTPDVELPGVSTPSAGVSSLVGYSQVGVLIARAATQVGVLNLNPVDQAAFEPFSSTNPLVVQMLELFNSIGQELTGKLRAHLVREFSFVTAASATSYALPPDYVEMVPDTGWDRAGVLPLAGPVTPQQAQFIKALGASGTVRVAFRIQGNRMTFPVAPADGLTITGEYYSEYWIQTAASATGPDADHATASTDYVLFDPLLMVLGLKLRFREAKGMDTTLALVAYEDRLEKVRGRVAGAGTLSLNGLGYWQRIVDGRNYPTTLGTV